MGLGEIMFLILLGSQEQRIFGHHCWDLEKIRAGVEWKGKFVTYFIHIRSSLNKALLEQG